MIALETDYQLNQFDGAWSIDPLGIQQAPSTTEHRCSIVHRIDACHGKFLAGFNLEGRWFEHAHGRLYAIGDRVRLLDDPIPANRIDDSCA